jgi:predicted phage terminase large subunit-like protein
MVKQEWFKTYVVGDEPSRFELILQSWDTANKSTELSDYSVCTTWGRKDQRLYLLHVYRKRLEFPDLKRAIVQLATLYGATNIVIEDKASGTQLIQDLSRDGVYGVARYEPKMDKIMRPHSVTSTIENGLVFVPTKAEWLGEYLHELTTFPYGKYDDQTDSTSQALDWIKNGIHRYGVIEYCDHLAEEQGLYRDTSGRWMPKQNVESYVAVHQTTGQKIRWDGNDWVDFNTGEPHAG